MHFILASTSTLFGETYLAYLQPSMKTLYAGIDEIIFIPFARPGGISHDDYTSRATEAFGSINIKVRGLHTFSDPVAAIKAAKGFFTGGGNTFLLVKQLHELGLMEVLGEAVKNGAPYMGCSAGSNIGGLTMQNTNDMPIVYPPSFATMGLLTFNINPHYQDPVAGSQHMGETRETRIREYHTQNNTPVLGLREGSWIYRKDGSLTLEGNGSARVFEAGKEPYELPAGSSLAALK
ncbi:Dipeptidase E [Chitinophaga sp. 180180018-2]|nr:Dipeptidase E [Chitinophaga sp. 212800010-3]